jgi:anti-sigma factor RsiW
MDCRELEDQLEALLDGVLAEEVRRRCARHLEACPTCRELVEPHEVATAPPPDLIGDILARTSGSPCGRAHSLLCGWLDGELAATERELMATHLESCADCRALATVATRLAAELPLLAELRPDHGFVDAVLAVTLPPGVRLRRWWESVWPQWVRRPRFASEAAFVATMVLALIFATPGSPLGAVPTKALELAQTDPAARFEEPVAALEERFTSRVEEPLRARYARGEAEVRAWAKGAERRGRALASEVADWFGTSRELLASLLESADAKASASEEPESNPTQETP